MQQMQCEHLYIFHPLLYVIQIFSKILIPLCRSKIVYMYLFPAKSRRYMAEILTIRRKTRSNQSINPAKCMTDILPDEDNWPFVTIFSVNNVANYIAELLVYKIQDIKDLFLQETMTNIMLLMVTFYGI